MKKVLSIFLALALLVSLTPAVFAADAEINVTYDFSGVFDANKKFSEVKGENWEVAGIKSGTDGITMDSLVKDSTNGVTRNNSSNIRVSASTGGSYWIAFKLTVPETAKYSLTFKTKLGTCTTPTAVNAIAYLFEAGTTIEDGMKNDNKIETESFTAASAEKSFELVKDETLSKGEYYFVCSFKTTDKTAWVAVQSLTLNGTVAAEPEVTPDYEEAFGEDTYEIEENVNVNPDVKVVAYANGETISQTTTSATKIGDVYEIKTDATIGDYTFRYWARGLENAEKGNRRIVSLENNFTYSAEKGDANWLIAVYTKDGEDAETEYFNANGQLIPDATDATRPYMLGYGYATDWKDNGNGIKEAVYGNGVQSYNITVNGKSDLYKYGAEIVCPTVEVPENKYFWGWTKKVGNAAAELVSTETNYTFYAWEDCVVEPMFGDSELVRGDIIARKILISKLDIGNNESVIKAEFIGFGDAVERGITLGSKDYAMTRDDATQFAIINDVNATEISAYAILEGGTKYVYTYVAPTAE